MTVIPNSTAGSFTPQYANSLHCYMSLERKRMRATSQSPSRYPACIRRILQEGRRIITELENRRGYM